MAHSNKLQIKVFIIEYENDLIERDSKSFCGIYSLQNRKRHEDTNCRKSQKLGEKKHISFEDGINENT
jgi:hypothetical protein